MSDGHIIYSKPARPEPTARRYQVWWLQMDTCWIRAHDTYRTRGAAKRAARVWASIGNSARVIDTKSDIA